MRRWLFFPAALIVLISFPGCLTRPGSSGAAAISDLDQGRFPAGTFFTLSAEQLRRSVEAVPASDPDVQVVYREVRHRVDEQGRIETRYRWLYQVLSQVGVEGWSSTRATWSPWYEERPEIRARVTNPDGSQHLLDPDGVVESSVAEESSRTYSDRKLLRAPFPAIAIGSIVEEEITVREHQPYFGAGRVLSWLPRFKRPVYLNRLIIEIPETVPFSYRVDLLEGLQPARTKDGDRITYLFEERESPPEEEIEDNLPLRHPHWPQVSFCTGATWQEVAAGYGRLVEKQLQGFQPPDSAPAAVTGDPLRSAARYLGWIRERVRYTALFLGERSIVPTRPEETLQRGFGDCKDKAVLLVGLLRSAGFRADVALVNAGRSWDVFPDLPGLGDFNHAVVYVYGNPPILIDATSEYSDGGTVPTDIQGRYALVASPDSENLVTIPVSPSSSNTMVQTREYRLAADGFCDVVETTRYTGTLDSYFRRKLAGAVKEKLAEEWEADYIPNTYRFGRLTESSLSDPFDLDIPFTVQLQIAGAGRAVTEKAIAQAAILETEIIDWLPDALREEKDRPRREPFRFYQPLVAELRFRIVPPLGFTVRELPPEDTYLLGPVSIRRTCTVERDGTVNLVLTLDTGVPEITAEEFETARARVLEYKKREALVITFDHRAARLTAEGDYARAIAAFKELIAREPGNTNHRILMSETLLAAGLAEEAAAAVRRAVELDPQSADGWAALGWVLQHDPVGRRFHPGFDRDGAVSAYLRAIELDGEDWRHKANLAILLEHDQEGYRYSADADLDGAIRWYEQISDKDGEQAMRPNHLNVLFWAGRYAEVRRMIETISDEERRLMFRLACLAAEEGVSKALMEASSINPPDKRRQALAAAGELLSNRRLYAAAAELFREAAQGSNEAMHIESLSDQRAVTVPHENIGYSASDPVNLIKRFLIGIFRSRGRDFSALEELVTEAYYQRASEGDLPDSFEQQYMSLRALTLDQQMIKEAYLDVLLSVLTFTVEGDLHTGYHLQAAGGGETGASFYYLAPKDGRLLVAGSLYYESQIGAQIADFLDVGNRTAAERWLDWMAEDYAGYQATVGKGDRFAGLAFYRFWDREHRDPGMISYAAAAIMAGGKEADGAVPILQKGRFLYPDRSVDFDHSLLIAYLQLHRFAEAERIARRLVQEDPDSVQAMRFLTYAQLSAGKTLEAAAAALSWIDRHPDHEENADLLMILEPSTYPQRRLEEVFTALENRGLLDASDYNTRAWLALFSPPVTEGALRHARTAVSLSQGNDEAILHTMASLYADVGRCEEAKRILDREMELRGLVAPGSDEWYVIGRIAEQYGLSAAAREAYRQVDTPEPGDLVWLSCHTLARRRLQAMEREH
jgi:tetratricopeptide (TPR) repeat protein/transglutaminase-like putative cysteine protease